MTKENSEKLTTLYNLYEQPMYRIAYAVLHDEGLAEDAVSDAFIRILGKLHKFEDCRSTKTRSYIVKVIKSTSINIYRKNKRRHTEEVPIDESIQIADVCANTENKNHVDNILNTLEEPDRSIVIMRCIKEMSWRDVAQKLSLTESNVRKRFERTKKRLRMKGGITDEK
ncbi:MULTISPECIES: RNA polymerase sigma factor [Ruminococcus]|uniref:RNA polymerase sigma-70 factor, ECF subfamily n=1 Tax=Ruminococcus flavefaciens TaxID=1265 RepID=A0A1M7H629_RUMFL|nr:MULTISPECIES: sigma-70 family RNA polymerase sigma factor [Ruminococcus]MCR4795252.1 sigma-70 family RNA polymerase sigma factor [Ruminococcus sp.]SHM24051.1 RNA polymerase sigma-70 factor, ECF subfamily [Ruminococcus flavefaciens]